LRAVGPREWDSMSTDTSEMKQHGIDEQPRTTAGFPTPYLRFGAFQVDLQREAIWRDGERVKVQSKVYQTLLILLSRAGNVVTREEVRKHLWPDNLTLKFDANVNTSMNKLRQVLGDSPDRPTYIETIPRRGYCFVAPLEFADELKPAPPRVIRPTEKTDQGKVTRAEQSGRQLLLPRLLPTGLRIATLLLAGMVVGALLVLAWFSYSRSHRAFSSSRAMTHDQVAVLECLRGGAPPAELIGRIRGCRDSALLVQKLPAFLR
jgi:DNA-binding winged helix-turn-helix (wHTH) protein